MWRSITFLEIAALLASYFCMPFYALRSYSVGAECIYKSNYYLCTTPHTGEWNAANWSAITGQPSRPLLHWFDLFNHQFERLQAENNLIPFRMPAAFFEFGEIQWASQSKTSKEQKGVAIFRLHIGLESYFSSYDTSKTKTQHLANLDYMDYVFESLQLKSGTHFAKLHRSADQTASDYNNIVVHTIDFQTTVYHQITDNSSFDHTVTTMHVNPDYSATPYKRLVNGNFDNVVVNNAPAE